jgi:hypothetical protein
MKGRITTEVQEMWCDHVDWINLAHGNESGLRKIREISWQAEQLSSSTEEPCSVELGINQLQTDSVPCG